MAHDFPVAADDPADRVKPRPAPGLYLVATPIGNLGDISLRALELLAAADLVACEDTRVTAKLFQRFGIATRRVAYHDHNADAMRPKLIEHLARGEIVALVSDAGTPLVSDPGFKLVEAARDAGHGVTALPGASAVLTALQLSGLPVDRFCFAGFLDSRSVARRRGLGELQAVPATLVFFESGPRLADSLADMAAVLGDRPAAVARELTKLHEEVRRAPLTALAAHYAEAGPPKGEIVVVVGPPLAVVTGAEDLDAMIRRALEHLSVRDAAESVAKATNLPRRAIYARALELSGDGDDPP